MGGGESLLILFSVTQARGLPRASSPERNNQENHMYICIIFAFDLLLIYISPQAWALSSLAVL